MAEIDFTVTGTDEMDAAIAALGEKWLEAAAEVLRAEAEAIMTDSKTNYVPVDRGGAGLQGTGHVERVERTRDGLSVRMAYGGPAARYAQAIHEHLSEYSPPSWKKAEASGHGVHFRHGGPKYLERPILKALGGMADRIAVHLRTKLGT